MLYLIAVAALSEDPSSSVEHLDQLHGLIFVPIVLGTLLVVCLIWETVGDIKYRRKLQDVKKRETEITTDQKSPKALPGVKR